MNVLLIRRAASSLLVLASLLQAPSSWADAANARYVAGENRDPRIRSAQFLGKDQRHYSALTELLRMQAAAGEILPEEYQWQLAQSYVNFAMRSSALPLYRDLALNTDDPQRLADSRLRLAELQYERGYNDEARATLNALREKLPTGLVLGYQDLMTRVLMKDGRYGEALNLFSEFKTGDAQTAYMRFNLAVALMNDGQVQKGRDVLDRLGRMRVEDVETLALRDRANLTLGWNFLKAALGGTAKPIFQRIRVEGPFSNRALLGLGWAELAPRGERQTRELPDDQTPFTTFSSLGGLLRPGFLERDVFKRANLRFKLGEISKDEEEALARALVPWVELLGRDPMDHAVQEAWLAIPYALDRLSANKQALQYYQRAVQELEKNRQRILIAENSIKENRMVETIVRRDLDSESGWEWKLLDLPDAPETYYLQNLLAEHRYQEALKNYRDIRLMARSIDASAARLTQLELRYVTRAGGQGEVDASELVKRARQNWRAPWTGQQIKLNLDDSLGAEGSYKTPLEMAPAQRGLELKLAEAPARFNGPLERIARLRAAKDRIREQLALAGGEQAKLLQLMSITELQGQKKAVEKYLVEARFALARIYDSVLKAPAAPAKEEAKAEAPEGWVNRFLQIFGVRDRDTKTTEKAQ